MIGKFLVLFSIFLFYLLTFYDAAESHGCSKDLNSTEKETCCTLLYEKIKDKHPVDCCKYPRFVISINQYQKCVAECDGIKNRTTKKITRCCHLPCCLTYLNVTDVKTSFNGINKEALKASFYNSVYNDTKWLKNIDSNVDMCYNQYRKDVPKISNSSDIEEIEEYEDFWDCQEVVPTYLYSIIDCVYYRNFLSCPTSNSDSCPEWKNLIKDCYLSMDQNEE